MLDVTSELVMSLIQIQGDDTVMDQGIFAYNDSIKIETLPLIFVSLHKGSAKQ